MPVAVVAHRPAAPGPWQCIGGWSSHPCPSLPGDRGNGQSLSMKVEPPSRRPLTGVIFGDRSAARSALAAVAEGKRWISAVFGELGSKIGEKCKCHELVNTPPIRVVFVNSASVRIGVVFPLGLPPAPSIVLNDNGYPP